MNGRDLIYAFGGVDEHLLEDMLLQNQRQKEKQALRAKRRRLLFTRALGLASAAAAAALIAAILINTRRGWDDPVILPSETVTEEQSTQESTEESTQESTEESTQESTEESTEDARQDARPDAGQDDLYDALPEIPYGSEYPVSVRHDGESVAKQWESALDSADIGRLSVDIDGDGADEVLMVRLEKSERQSQTYDGGNQSRLVLTPVLTAYERSGDGLFDSDTISLSEISVEGDADTEAFSMASTGYMLADFFLARDGAGRLILAEIHKREEMFADGSSDAFAALRYEDGKWSVAAAGSVGSNEEGTWREQDYIRKLAELGLEVPDCKTPIRSVVSDTEGIARLTYETTADFEEKAVWDADPQGTLTAGSYRIAPQEELGRAAAIPGGGAEESTEDDDDGIQASASAYDGFAAAQQLFRNESILRVISCESGLLMDIYGDESHSEEGANVWLYPQGVESNRSQLFRLVSRGQMWYSIIPLSNEELAVGIEGGEAAEGANVCVRRLDPEDPLQGWTPEWSDGRWLLHSAADISLVLAVSGNESRSNAELARLNPDDGRQYWNIEPAE